MAKQIAIIGGWAAGIMAAATLLEREDLGSLDTQIHLFEKNSKLGTKIIISGWGRCNVTTWTVKLHELQKKYPRGGEFLVPALQMFGPRAIRRWFEEHNVPLKQEEDLRVFPVSDDGKDIVRVFERIFSGNSNITLHLKEGVTGLIRNAEDKKFEITTEKETYQFDVVILAPWWNAYSHTWSAGDGYAWLRELWHSITPLGPSLNSFLTKEQWSYELSWTDFPDAVVKWILPSEFTVNDGSNEPKISSRGPILLTHFGLSGPAIFAFSSYLPYVKIEPDCPFECLIQPIADMSSHHRLIFFQDAAKLDAKKELGTIIATHFTKKFSQTFLTHFGFDPHQQVAQLSKLQRHELSVLLGEWIPFTFLHRRPWDEFVTAGGVKLDEVNNQTWESKLVPNLYFAWEILDIDWHTGWYNFTSSWAMGRLVWISIK